MSEDDTFDMVIEFKDPDGCQQFAYWADTKRREDAINKAIEDEGLDPDDEETREAVEDEVLDRIYNDPESANKKFFRWGEYGAVELVLKRDGTGTCRLIPNGE